MLSFLLYNTVAQAVWCPFEPPAIGSIECPDGFICKDFQCQQPSLGASTSDRVVCTVAPPNIGAWLCEEGEDCIDHKCVPRLGASGTEKSSVGGKCGSNGVFDAPTYECADGLICNPPMRNGMHIFGAYGTCAETPALGSWHPARGQAPLGASSNPVSGLGGKCGWPGYPGSETFDCASGLICNRHGKMGGYGTCEQAPLGASTNGVAQLGEECACADCGPSGITRPCASGLICFNSCSAIPGCEGGMSTCQYPALGSSNPVSGLGGKCGWPGYPGAETFDCASGLICNRHGKMGGYGTCEQAKLGRSANPVSGIGGKCGWPGYLGAETFDCATGLTCNRHGKMGGYGTCEQAPLGASIPPPDFGSHCVGCKRDSANGPGYCNSGLECYSWTEGSAWMWSCLYADEIPSDGKAPETCGEHASLGETPLGASDDRVVCSVRPPAIGSWLCKEGEDCVDHKCVPRLGASANPVSGLGGKCGWPGYPGAETFDCASGLICNRHGKMGGYGTCEQAPLGASNNRVVCTVSGGGSWLCKEGEECVDCAYDENCERKCAPRLGASANPVSGLGGKCGWPGYLGAETFDCASGLICNRHGRMGGYGTCEQAPLGASANPVSGRGGKCGWPGYPGGETFDCASGLICNRHGKMGGYGTCEQAPLGAGFHYCQTDADCPSTEPICHHPPKDFPELMPTCIADEFGSAPLGSSLESCMTSADCPKGKTCVNPLVMGAPVEGWCAYA